MAVLQKFSFDEKRIKKYKRAKDIKNNSLWQVTNKESYQTYKKLLEKNIIYKFDNSNLLYIRVKTDILPISS